MHLRFFATALVAFGNNDGEACSNMEMSPS